MVQRRGTGKALVLLAKPPPRHKGSPIVMNVIRAWREFRSDAPRSAVERNQRTLGKASIVVPPRHEDIARVAAHIQVLHPLIETQPSNRKCVYDKAPMGLLLGLSQNVFERESACRATVTSQEEGRVGRTLGKSSWPLSHVSRLCQSCPTWR